MISFLPSELFTPLSLPHQIVFIFLNSLGFALFVTVLNRKKIKSQIAKSFLGMGLSMFFWVDSAYFARVVGPENLSLATTLLKTAWVATPLLFAFTYLTSTLIIEKEKRYKKLTYIIFVTNIILSSLIALSDFVIKGIKFTNGNLDIIYGILTYPFLALIFLTMVATLIPIFHSNLSKTQHKRSRIFLIGLMLFYIMNVIFNIVLPILFNITYLYYLGDYSTFFLLGFTAYLILKHNFLGIKVISTELLTYFLIFLIFVRFVTSTNMLDRVINFFLLISTMILGALLIQSVVKEVESKIKLAKSNKKLKELDELKDEFISITSHELKTPVSIIKNNLWMLNYINKGKSSKKQQHLITEANNGLNRLSVMINNLLNVSRIQQGRLQFNITKFDLDTVIEQAIERFKPMFKNRGLKLTKGKHKAGNVYGDKEKVSEVMDNYLSNAYKYTEKGFVHVDVVNKKDFVIVTVSDTGPGIRKEDYRKIFTKFGRAKEGLKQNGRGASTGLGLYIVKYYIESMGGKVGFVSKVNKGTSFWFSLKKKE